MKKTKKFSPPKATGSRQFDGQEHIKALYKSDDWIKYSKVFLENNPRCYACGEKSQVTDHWRPHKGDIELFQKTDNSIPLCVRCHNTVTAKFDRYGGKDKLEEKLRWLSFSRSRNGLTFKVKVLSSFFQR